jgi:hypothetical protein
MASASASRIFSSVVLLHALSNPSSGRKKSQGYLGSTTFVFHVNVEFRMQLSSPELLIGCLAVCHSAGQGDIRVSCVQN